MVGTDFEVVGAAADSSLNRNAARQPGADALRHDYEKGRDSCWVVCFCPLLFVVCFWPTLAWPGRPMARLAGREDLLDLSLAAAANDLLLLANRFSPAGCVGFGFCRRGLVLFL